MKGKVKHGLGMLSIFLTILTLVITITINAYPLYVIDVDYLGILDWVDLGKKELLYNYQELMKYLNYPWKQQLILPDFPVSDSGAFHFYEVKKLFMLNYGVLFVSLIPSMMYVNFLKRNKRLWQLIRPFQIVAMIPLFLGFVMMTGFDFFFTAFHTILFNNDDWIFNPRTDPIINALPEEYFIHCFLLAFILLEIFLFIGIYFGKQQLKEA